MVHNFVQRILPEYEEGNNVDPIGYRFEILYIGNLVLTDGTVYPTFDECCQCLCRALMRLHVKPLDSLVVDFGDM